MNSIDTFQLYIDSLDSSSPLNQAPAKPSRAIPSPPDDSFDTSYVDSVIFGGGGVAATADPEESNCDFIGTPDPAFTSQASFKSEEVSQIDSGLSSPENVGSFTRPSFLQLNSFMIWNDPDQGNPDANGFPASQRATSPLSDLSSPTESWPASKTEEEEAQETNTGVTIQPVYPGAPPGSLNMKTMKKRGLFSRSATAGGAAALGHNELSDVSVSDLKMPKSPTNSTSQLNSSSGNSVGAGGLNAEQDEDRFNGDGVMFHGKLIGSEYVAEARGEQMCQQSLKKLKIIQKAMGGHKRRIHLYISFDGIKIQDSLTTEQLFHHTVPQISFISRDETDTRAFGYVFGNSTTGHQFIGIKTKKEAMVVMTTIGQLFAITLKRKRSAEEAAALAAASDGSSTSAAGPAVLVEGADEHMYHSVYDMEAGGRSSSRRSRTTSGNSDNAPIPALPPPISDGHHRRGHSSASASNSLAVNQPTTVKLAPPGGSSHTSNNVLFNEMDLFVGGAGGFDPHSVPVAGPANYAEKNPKLSSSSFEWANFDDDAANLSAAANVNSSSIMDDSTLNTISSISDMNVNASQLSSSKTLSQNDATTSGTLVARYNVKNHPKTGSSSTIASTNFDGADPFSDAFGSDDPFSGSLAAGASELSGSLGASTNFKPHDSHSAQMLANQFGSIHLDRSTGSFKNNLDLSNSFSKQSVDSTSSADRYAALSDIHNLSNSIFDSFGNKKSDLPSGAGNRKASNVPSKAAGGNLFGSRHGATPPPAQGNLFASGSFSQGSAFQSQQPSVPFVTTTAGHNVAMYGQQPMYHSAVTTPGVMMTSAGPVAVTMMAPVGSASQMMYNPAVSSVAMAMAPPMHNSLAHSAQWSAASTSSLPTAFGMPPEAAYYQQQQQFLPGTSPLASSGFGAANIAVSSGNGGMLLQRNGNLQASSSSLFATPPIAAQSFSSSSPASSIPLNGSNGSMNRTTGELPPLFSDLDLLGKSKTAFPMQKQDQMFQQQQSLDSFTRNQFATAATGNGTMNPFM